MSLGKKTIGTPNGFLTAEQWLSLSTEVEENQVVFGSPSQCIVRPFTKNLVQGAEKTFKTTLMLRLMLGLSSGVTVFPQLPVIRPRKVLYVHGELSPPEIKERTVAAVQWLNRPLENFYQGRDLKIHLATEAGQNTLKNLVNRFGPEDLVLDPWQGFIPGLDENEFKDVSKATHFLDELIEELKVTIYLVTHTGKDQSRGTRGHSSLAGWRDTLFKLERKKQLLTVTVEPRWAAPIEPFTLEFRDQTLWPTEKTEFAPQVEKIRTFLRSQEGEASKADLGTVLGLSGDSLRKALKRAEAANAIVIAGENIRLPETHQKIVDEMSALASG